MTIPIDSIVSPDLVQVDGDIFIEVYCNKTFTASSGKVVPVGNLQTGNWCIREACTVVAGVLTVPVLNIEPTEDGIDSQIAKYSAYLRQDNQQPVPFYETGFTVPPLNVGQTATTWPRLMLHKRAVKTLPDNQTYNKTQVGQLIDLVAGAFLKASSVIYGTVKLSAPSFSSIAVSDEDYRLTTSGKDVRDYGVIGDGSTDDTVAFNSAINNTQGHRIIIPRQLTIKTQYLHYYGKIGCILQGEKGGSYQDTASQILYGGAAHGTLVDIINSGSLRLVDLTLNSGGFNAGLAGYADTLVSIDKSADTGTYGVGSTSEITVENVTCLGGTTNLNVPNAAFLAIAVNRLGGSNCELMRFRRVSGFLGGVGNNDQTNINRGSFIDFVNFGNNSLNNVVEDCYVFGAYIPFRARNGAQVRFINNEGNYGTIVYRLNGDGNCKIEGDRHEMHRQFVVMTGGGSVTLDNNILPNGGWDAAYPVVELQGGGLITSIDTEFSAQSGIQAYGNTTTPNGRLIVIGGGVPNILLSGFGTFGGGATVIGGTYMAGDNSQSQVITNAPIRWMTSVGAADTAENLLEIDDSGFIRLGSPATRQVRLRGDQFVVDGSVAANEIRLLVWDVSANTLKRVIRGAADSGGAGLRALTIAN